MTFDPYQFLALSPSATAKDIKQRHLAFVRKWHPDQARNEDDRLLTELMTKKANAARDQLLKTKTQSSKIGNAQPTKAAPTPQAPTPNPFPNTDFSAFLQKQKQPTRPAVPPKANDLPWWAVAAGAVGLGIAIAVALNEDK